MGPNPMQKIKRNSTLLGITIGLIIGLILCALVYLFLSQTPGGITKSDEQIYVTVLTKSVKSGETINVTDISTKAMNKRDIPADAVTVTTPVVAKIDLTAGTVLTQGMLNKTSETITADLREQEYNMITLPTQLEKGDFIDIRLQLPNGGDYIVISKKEVLKCNSSTVWLRMNEEEILTMSNAIIEYYIMAGSKLYATTYTEPGMQTASTPTYCPNADVEALMRTYKNAGDQQLFSNALINIRNNNINPSIREYNENAIENIEKNIQEEIKTLKESRESYFSALNSVY